MLLAMRHRSPGRTVEKPFRPNAREPDRLSGILFKDVGTAVVSTKATIFVEQKIKFVISVEK
jgi:hypothetical protein